MCFISSSRKTVMFKGGKGKSSLVKRVTTTAAALVFFAVIFFFWCSRELSTMCSGTSEVRFIQISAERVWIAHYLLDNTR